MYRVETDTFAKCQYAVLTNKQYAAVLVVDIDQYGEAGGHPSNLAAPVRTSLRALIEHNVGPAWVGINPQNGKVKRQASSCSACLVSSRSSSVR